MATSNKNTNRGNNFKKTKNNQSTIFKSFEQIKAFTKAALKIFKSVYFNLFYVYHKYYKSHFA